MADGNNQMSVSIKGNPEHLDDMIQMLQGKSPVAATPSMPAAPAPPPLASPILGSNLLGMVPAAGAVEAAGESPLPMASPLGQRPGPGLLGRIGHGLAVAGDIAGTALAPRLMPWIPGTPQHQIMEEELQRERIAAPADVGVKGAQKDYYESEAYKNLHPEDAVEKDQWHPIGGTNHEINYANGETREMKGVPAPQAKTVPERAQWVVGPDGTVSYLPESLIASKPGEYKPYKALGNMTPLQLFLQDPQKFAEYMQAMKKDAMGSKYAMVRLLGEVANYYPGLGPLIPQALEQAGLKLPPGMEKMDFLAGQPRSFTTGERIGLRMPEAPTGTVRTRGQMAQDVLQRLPEIEPMIEKLDKEGKLGPGAGRINDLITGKIGAGDPEFKQLANQLETTASAFARLHLNTEKGLQPFFQMLNSGKLTAANLRAGLKTIRDWSQTYARTGAGNQPRERSAPGPKGPWERFK